MSHFPKVISKTVCICCFVYLKQGFHVLPWWDGDDHRLMMSSQNRDDWSVFCSLSLSPRWFSVPDVSSSLFEKYGFRSLPMVLWAIASANQHARGSDSWLEGWGEGGQCVERWGEVVGHCLHCPHWLTVKDGEEKETYRQNREENLGFSCNCWLFG